LLIEIISAASGNRQWLGSSHCQGSGRTPSRANLLYFAQGESTWKSSSGYYSLVRWLVVIVAVIAVVRYALVTSGRARSSGMDRGLISGYTGLLDLNVLLG
jgi:hypothetical protein